MKIPYQQIQTDVYSLGTFLKQKIDIGELKVNSIFGIPRGGVVVAAMLCPFLQLPLVDEPTVETLVVDDLIDSGKTILKYKDHVTAALYVKHKDKLPNYFGSYLDPNEWVEFPWEDTSKDIEDNLIRILEYVGEDPSREGLVDTPKRYLKFLKEFTAKEKFNFTTFTNEGTDEMIIQKDIPFYSLCEHHTAPFFGQATVAYIPNDKIVGLSKLARTVQYYAHNFQNQERITTQVADRLDKELAPKGVGVTLAARHLCMEMRGVKVPGTHTVTTKLMGAFKEDEKTRAEYMANVRNY